MDEKKIISQPKRHKVLLLALLAVVFIHIFLFSLFRLKFFGTDTIKEDKTVRITRVPIPETPGGSMPKPLPGDGTRSDRPDRREIRPEDVVRKPQPVESEIKIPSEVQPVDEAKADDVADPTVDDGGSADKVMDIVKGGMGGSGDGDGSGGGDGEGEGEGGGEGERSGLGAGEGKDEIVTASTKPEKYLGTMATPVVVSKPRTSIMETFTDIPYPDEIKIKRENLTAGICRVYLRLTIDERGEIMRIDVRSPKTKEDKARYAMFLDTVIDTVKEWDYDKKRAVVSVDVRFTIK